MTARTQTIAEILAKVEAKRLGRVIPEPMVYSPRDIAKAKIVLDRLLAAAASAEVTSIRPLTTYIEES